MPNWCYNTAQINHADPAKIDELIAVAEAGKMFEKMDDLFLQSSNLIAEARKGYQTYHPSQQFIDHLHYATEAI